MPRQPIYILADHAPNADVDSNAILASTLARLKGQAGSEAHVSLIEIARVPHLALALTPVQQVSSLTIPETGEGNLYEALRLAAARVKQDLRPDDETAVIILLLTARTYQNYEEALRPLQQTDGRRVLIYFSASLYSESTFNGLCERSLPIGRGTTPDLTQFLPGMHSAPVPTPPPPTPAPAPAPPSPDTHHESHSTHQFMRRLPVYFLLDTSGSMHGEPIQALNNALSGMITTLRMDAQALDSLWISIITFDRDVKELVPLTELVSFQLPEITCPESGPTHTGRALEVLHEKVRLEVRKGSADQKGDWRPLLFLFTDGKPSDLQTYRETIPKIKALNFAAVVACAAGPQASDALLKELTDSVVHLDTADSSTLKTFFKWVSSTIEQGNKSMGTQSNVTLPPPPTEIIFVS